MLSRQDLSGWVAPRWQHGRRPCSLRPRDVHRPGDWSTPGSVRPRSLGRGCTRSNGCSDLITARYPPRRRFILRGSFGWRGSGNSKFRCRSASRIWRRSRRLLLNSESRCRMIIAALLLLRGFRGGQRTTRSGSGRHWHAPSALGVGVDVPRRGWRVGRQLETTRVRHGSLVPLVFLVSSCPWLVRGRVPLRTARAGRAISTLELRLRLESAGSGVPSSSALFPCPDICVARQRAVLAQPLSLLAAPRGRASVLARSVVPSPLGARSAVAVGHGRRMLDAGAGQVALAASAVAPDESGDGVLAGAHVDERQALAALLVEQLLLAGALLLAQGAGPGGLLLLVELAANALLLGALEAALLGARHARLAVGLAVELLGLLGRHGRAALRRVGARHEALHAQRVGHQREGVLSRGHDDIVVVVGGVVPGAREGRGVTGWRGGEMTTRRSRRLVDDGCIQCEWFGSGRRRDGTRLFFFFLSLSLFFG